VSDRHDPPAASRTRLFVVRVWHEEGGDTRVWRASVRVEGGARRYFPTPEALLQYLGDHLRHA